MAPMIDANIDIAQFEVSAGRAAALLQALANEKRLMILCLLADRELSVGELQSRLGLSQSALSQHLMKLRRDNLVRTRRASQMVFYSIEDRDALKVVATLAEIFCPVEPNHDQADPPSPR